MIEMVFYHLYLIIDERTHKSSVWAEDTNQNSVFSIRAAHPPFAAVVGRTDRTRHRGSIEVTHEFWVRHTHLKRQVFTQLEAVVAARRKHNNEILN